MASTTAIEPGVQGDASTPEAVRPFSALGRADVAYAGGKGANLGELTAAGLPVPDGFVVGASAYALFCDAGGLRSRIEARLAPVDVDDTEALSAATAEVRVMVESEPVPAEVETAIREAYEALSAADADDPVAVRSSATAEDTEAASFAGMNETFLNIRGADAVVDAVRRCWSSLFGARTVFYRAKRGFGQADMDIAVVVQRQVLATRAGVMFTIDPASGDTGRLVIEGSFGLGEAVVSGSVSPDRYLVQKEDLAITAREVRRKELVIEPVADGGTVTRELEDDEAMRPVLSDDEVREIAGLGRRIEEHYGSAQDTEWCYDPEGIAFMLQSRPVTSSGGAPAEAAAHDGEIARPRPRRRARRRQRPCSHRSRAGRRGQACGGRDPGHPHDRAGLGAADAALGGHRHRLGRDDLPRGHRLTRARHPLRRRHAEATTKLRDGELVTVDAAQGGSRGRAQDRPRPPARRGLASAPRRR